MTDDRTVSLVSLGCPKNLVDSEGIVSDLLSQDIHVVVDPADAQVVLVNTCGFLGSARDESLKTIRKIVDMKEQGLRGVVVTGCMVGQYRKMLLDAVPEVDRLVDFGEYRQIPSIVDDLLPPRESSEGASFQPGRYVQARLTPAHYAYLKVSEGCNHTCSFCVIPSIRGRMKSVPFEELLERARRLSDLGARELDIIGQDTTMYGTDIYAQNRLPELLARLSDIDDVRWIRLLYAYPTEVTDDLIDVLADDNRVLPYIDVPLQHTNEKMLGLMNRRSSEKCVEDLMLRLRDQVPGITIRTTFIVGFPGETEDDFQHMLGFVKRHRIDRLGAFTWSPEEGSKALHLPDPVPEETKIRRLDELMTLQKGIARELNAARVGNTIEVLVDDPADGTGPAMARSAADAPEIDGCVRVHGRPLRAGEMVDVTIKSADDYDLEADLA